MAGRQEAVLSPVEPHPSSISMLWPFGGGDVAHTSSKPQPQPHPGPLPHPQGHPSASGGRKGEARRGIRDHYDIMVSYSRRNKDFAIRVVQELERLGSKIWVDWSNIPPSSDWRSEIAAGIEGANNVLFILSPDWVASGECQAELELAVKANKKLIPVLHQDAPAVPEALSSINWIYMRFTDSFQDGIQKIDNAAKMDLDLIRLHTRLLVRSKEWVESGSSKASSKLLTGKDLREALDWRERVKEANRRAVRITEEQERFINASAKRAKFTKAVLITVSTIAVVAIIAALIAAIVAAIDATNSKNEAQKQEKIAKQALADLSVSNAKLNATYTNLTIAYTQLEAQNILISAQKAQIERAYKELQESLRSSNQRQAVGSARAAFDEDKQLAVLLGVLATNSTQFTANAQNLVSSYNALRDFVFDTQGAYIEGSTTVPSGTASLARRRTLLDAGGGGGTSGPGGGGGAAAATATAAGAGRLRGGEGGGAGARRGALSFGRDVLAAATAGVDESINLRELASSSRQQYTLVFPMAAFSENNNYLANVVLLRWRETTDLDNDVVMVRIAANVWDVSNDRLSKPVIKRTADSLFTGHAESVRSPPTRRFIPTGEAEVEVDLDGFLDAVVDFNGNVFVRTASFVSDGREVTRSFTRDRFYVNLPSKAWAKYDAAVTPGATITALSLRNEDLRLLNVIGDWTEFPGTSFFAPGAGEWQAASQPMGAQVLLSTTTCYLTTGQEAVWAWPRNARDHSNYLYLYVYDSADTTAPIKLWARFNVEPALRAAYPATGRVDWGYNNDRMITAGDCSALFFIVNDKIKIGGDARGNAATEGALEMFSLAISLPAAPLPASQPVNVTIDSYNRLANHSLAKPPVTTLESLLGEDYPRIKDRGFLLAGFVNEASPDTRNAYDAAGEEQGVPMAKAGYGAVFATKMRSPVGYDPLCVRHTLFYSTLTINAGVTDKYGLPVASVWPIAELDCSYGNDLNAFGAQAGAIAVHPSGPFVAVGTQSGVLRVYDTRSGLYASPLETVTLSLFTGAVRAVAFSKKQPAGRASTVWLSAGDVFGNFVLMKAQGTGFDEPVQRQPTLLFDGSLAPRATNTWLPSYRLRPARGLFSPAGAGCAFMLVGDATPAMWAAASPRDVRSSLWVYPADKTRTVRTSYVDSCLACNTDASKNARSYGWAPDGRLLGFMDASRVVAWRNKYKACSYPYKYAEDSAWTWARPLGTRDLLTQEAAEPVAWSTRSGFVAAAGVVYPIGPDARPPPGPALPREGLSVEQGNPETGRGTVLVDAAERAAARDQLFMSSAAAFSVNGTLLAGCLSFIEKDAAGTGMCKIAGAAGDCKTSAVLYLARLVAGAWQLAWAEPALGFGSSRCRRALLSSNIDAAGAATAYGAASVANGTAASPYTSVPFAAFDTRSMVLVVPFDRETLLPTYSTGEAASPSPAFVLRMSPTATRAWEGVPADPEDYDSYSAARNNSKVYDPQGPAFTDISIYNPPGTSDLYITGRSVARRYAVNRTMVRPAAGVDLTFSTPYELRTSASGRFLLAWSTYTAVRVLDLAEADPAATAFEYEFGSYYKGTKRTARLPVLPFISDDGNHLAFEYYPPDSKKIAYPESAYLNSGYEQVLKLRLVDLSVAQLPAKACSLVSRDITGTEYTLVFNETKPYAPCGTYRRQSFLALYGDPCKGRGAFDDATVKCACADPYSGIYCDDEPQEASRCRNGGVPDPISGACSCNAGRAAAPFYSGTDCSKTCPGSTDCSSNIVARL
eukprot:tig00000441_g707.t1